MLESEMWRYLLTQKIRMRKMFKLMIIENLQFSGAQRSMGM